MENPIIRVLIIEDYPGDVLAVQELLTHASHKGVSFRVEDARRLEVGLKLIRDREYDAALVDLRLPDSWGLNTLYRVLGRRPNLPVVILSATDDEVLARLAIEVGAQDYLVKGRIDAETLKRAILYAIERRKLLSGLETILESTADGIVLLDGERKVAYANSAAQSLFGLPMREWLGRPFGYTADPGPSEEISVRRSDGQQRLAEMRVRSLEWKGQEALLVCLRDITDRRRLEEIDAQARERGRLDELKERLAREFTQRAERPAAEVEAALSSLVEGALGSLNPAQAKLLRRAEENLHGLKRTLRETLMLSRLETGSLRLRQQELDLGALIPDLAAKAARQGEARGVVLELDIPDEPPPLDADPDLFAQLLENLFANAVDHASKRVQVLLRGESGHLETSAGTAEALRIIVANDGAGLAPDEVAALTAPPGTLPPADLGLAIAREIAERHGGHFWVESVLGKGTRFEIWFPSRARDWTPPGSVEPRLDVESAAARRAP